MQRVKLEAVVDTEQFNGALHVIDYRVFVHDVLGRGRELPASISEQDLAKWIAEEWRKLLTSGPECLPELHGLTTVVVDDSKLSNCYWRTLEYSDYKRALSQQTRKVLPDVQSAAPRCQIKYSSVRDIGYVVIAQLNLAFFSEPLYEADDWAGAIHRLAKAGLLNRSVLYSTIDSDWMQLVDNASQQWWCQSSNWGDTRLRNEAEVRHFAWQRLGRRISHPREIANVKQEQGDSADNLPAGADLALFDLCNANAKYKVPRLDKLLAACLS